MGAGDEATGQVADDRDDQATFPSFSFCICPPPSPPASDQRLDACDNHVEMTVADTGIGIPEEEIVHLGRRFHRVQTPGGRSNEGTGIGVLSPFPPLSPNVSWTAVSLLTSVAAIHQDWPWYMNWCACTAVRSKRPANWAKVPLPLPARERLSERPG
jgi:hypothetical protein